MSKYVRTNDNRIYKVVKENDYIFEVDTLNSYCDNAYNIFIDKKVVIKQSETIEELCDFVMVKFNWEKLPTVYDIEKLKNKVKELHGNNANILDNYKYLIEESKKQHTPSLKLDYIKFAIDTDKGLIYVAKMNKDGILELL